MGEDCWLQLLVIWHYAAAITNSPYLLFQLGHLLLQGIPLLTHLPVLFDMLLLG